MKHFDFFWKRARYCTSFDEKIMQNLNLHIDFIADESPIILIDDSLFKTRTKCVIMTNKRILWQKWGEKLYESIMLEDLKGSSVFASQIGLDSNIVIVAPKSNVKLHFNTIIANESLKIIFHDYLSKYCSGYDPFSIENARYYKKRVLSRLKSNSIISKVCTYTSLASFAYLILCDIISSVKKISIINDKAVCVSLIVILSTWFINIIDAKSKSKFSKFSLLVLFALLCGSFNYYWMLPSNTVSINEESIILKLSFMLAWLLFDRFEFDRFIKLMAILIGTLFILFAFMELAAGMVRL